MNLPAVNRQGINKVFNFPIRHKGQGILSMRSRLLRIGISSTLQFQRTIVSEIAVSLIQKENPAFMVIQVEFPAAFSVCSLLV